MNFITFEGHTIVGAMPINAMVKAMKDAERANPGATLDDLPGVICLYWDKAAGPGVILIEQNGETITQKVPPHKSFFLPGDSVVRLNPKNGEGVVLSITKNGAYSFESGAQSAISPPLVPVDGETPLRAAGLDWLRNGRVGASSYTLCVALTGATDPMREDDHDYPLDGSDFGRCVKFFEAVPQARGKIDEMKTVSPQWEALVSVWDELETLYEAEQNGGPRLLYDRMDQILDPLRSTRSFRM